MTSFRFDHPELLWLLLLAVPFVWLGWRSLAQLEPARRWTAIGLRLAVLTVLVLMLAGLQTVQRHSDLTVIAVVDQSESVRRFGQAPAKPQASDGAIDADAPQSGIEGWISSWLRSAASDRRETDRFGMVTFDGRPTVRSMPTDVVNLDPGTIETPIEGTNIAGSIRTTMAIYPPDSGTRMVLVSDGNETAGGAADVIAAAREAAAAGIPIDVVPIDYKVGNEVMVEGLYAPTEAREGQTVALRVVLRATSPGDGTLQLLHDEIPVDLNGDRPGTGTAVSRTDWTIEEEGAATASAPDAQPSTGLGRYVAVKQIDLPLGYSGANKFVAVFEPPAGAAGAAIGDSMSVNNRAEAFTLVQGKGRLLFVDNIGGESGSILPRALQSRGVELDVVPATGMPTSLAQLQRYDAVVLQNVPADLTTGPQQRMLAQYVNNLGGGLIMLGGPDSFGAGGWTNSPIDQILPVSCEIPSQTVLPSGALVIVMDRSGSMSSTVGGSMKTQQDLANEAAALAIGTLYPQDIVGVVVFDSVAQWVVPLRMNDDPGGTISTVRQIQSEGGTNIYSGLELGFQELGKMRMEDAAIRHMILLTDGQSTEPTPGGYIKLVGQLRKSGITLSTIGVGDGHDAQLLNQLAMMGGGQYHPILNPNQLPQVFIKEAKTIRKNLIKEGNFTPQLVQTGSPVMAGVGAVPELRGLVLTGAKSDPRVFMPILGPEGEPVFAHWQVGLGRSAAFTSDATNRWGTPWLGWEGYADFWARTMRLIARPSASRDIDLLTSVEGNRLTMRLDAGAQGEAQRRPGQGAAGGFGNFLRVRGSVLKPDGTAEAVELVQTGPGVYEADAPVEATGNYIVSLFVETPEGERRAVFGGASKPPGEELRRFEANIPLLQQVAQITGGRYLDAAAMPASGGMGLFSRETEFESRSVRPLWRTLLVLLLVLILLDVACRRIAWDPVAIAGWASAKVRGIGESMRGREVKGEATMAALKERRAAAREKMAGAEPTAPASTQARPVAQGAADAAPRVAVGPAVSAKRKFEAAGDYEAKDDFAQAVGGAKDDGDARRVAREVKKAAGVADEGSTTNRLLAAKRRAQQKLDEE